MKNSNQFSDECLDLLEKILRKNPADRLDAKSALKHTWFSSSACEA